MQLTWAGLARAKSAHCSPSLLWLAELGHSRSSYTALQSRAWYFRRAGKPLSTHHCQPSRFLNEGNCDFISFATFSVLSQKYFTLGTCWWNSFLISEADEVFSWFLCPFGSFTWSPSVGWGCVTELKLLSIAEVLVTCLHPIIHAEHGPSYAGLCLLL